MIGGLTWIHDRANVIGHVLSAKTSCSKPLPTVSARSQVWRGRGAEEYGYSGSRRGGGRMWNEIVKNSRRHSGVYEG